MEHAFMGFRTSVIGPRVHLNKQWNGFTQCQDCSAGRRLKQAKLHLPDNLASCVTRIAKRYRGVAADSNPLGMTTRPYDKKPNLVPSGGPSNAKSLQHCVPNIQPLGTWRSEMFNC